MATREDNLKAINAELEQMSDDELDRVAGGTYNQVAGDSRFLNDLGGFTDRYGATKTFFKYSSISNEVAQGWSNFGISLESSHAGDNQYYYQGKEITREQAMNIACAAVGKNIKNMDFTNY